jgi:hypothetical protein
MPINYTIIQQQNLAQKVKPFTIQNGVIYQYN